MEGQFLFLFFLVAIKVLHCKSASTDIEWIPGSTASIGDLEPAGDEPRLSYATNLMYVCRARVTVNDSSSANIAIVPGKYFPAGPRAGYAFFSFRGQTYEFLRNAVEFLSYPRGVVSWVPKEGILATTKFVVGGFDPDTVQPMYICRGRVDPENDRKVGVILGRYESGVCTIQIDGTIAVRTQFEVLSVNAYGLLHDVGDGA